MTYGIEYLSFDGKWTEDTTGDYETAVDAERAMRLASVVFPRVSHRVFEHATPSYHSSGRSAQARKTHGPRANG